MRYINQHVLIKDKVHYDGEEVPGGNGVIIDENRCAQTGAINGVYVMITDSNEVGHVRQAPLDQLVFKNPKEILEKNDDNFMEVLTMLFGMDNPIQA
tara:strand:+ start:231 stop:521 length:291 start_codon:yes stop_codon:yes gene_type:complete